jgi:hypothetical protein
MLPQLRRQGSQKEIALIKAEWNPVSAASERKIHSSSAIPSSTLWMSP